MSTRNPNWVKQYYFLPKDDLKTVEETWRYLRQRAKAQISASAQLKLEWIIYYHTDGTGRAKTTAQHFGITRKTFHKWYKRYKGSGLTGLEEVSRAPIHTRTRQIDLVQRVRVKSLRQDYPRLGKMKLVSLYSRRYKETISSWKIQKIIEGDNLYFDKVEASKLRKRHVQARIHQRQRITKFERQNKVNFLWHVDTVILTLYGGGYRYLLTAIDDVSKMAFARLYTTHSSRQAKDFLERLVYLTNRKVLNLHHDNGSEFKCEFEQACRTLGIIQWYSRPHTPKDNSVLERFNRTIQEEFVQTTDVDPLFVDDFNKKLTDWLIFYNWQRPHKTLDYKSPLEYLDSYYSKQVLPMYSSPTRG